MEDEINLIISDIRACLISTKGAIPLRQLESDYKTIIGRQIPYRKFGFHTLEDFLQTEKSLTLTRRDGNILVDAKRSAKSAHMSELIGKQKSKKKKVLRKFHQTSISKPVTTTRWRPKYPGCEIRNYQRSSRIEAVSHNQFINRSNYETPVVKTVTPKLVMSTSQKNAIPTPPKNTITTSPKIVIPKLTDVDIPSGSIKKIKSGAISQLKEMLVNNETFNRHYTKENKVIMGNNKESENDIKLSLGPCSSLLSTRQRIMKKISNMSVVQNNSKNNCVNQNKIVKTVPTSLPKISEFSLTDNPIQDNSKNNRVNEIKITKTVPPSIHKISEFSLTNNPIQDLKNFVVYFKISLMDVSFKKIVLKKNRFITCLIKIGKQSYTSYPKEFDTQEKAHMYCADKALKDLVPKYTRQKSQLIASTQDILEKIPPMLEKHNHGCWDWQVELDYLDKYHEKLPGDWLKTVDSSSNIQLEKCIDNYIVRFCNSDNVSNTTPKRSAFMTLSDVSVPSNTIQLDDGKLLAEITCVMSANEIWCAQYSTEESDKFDDMMIRLEKFYDLNENNTKTETVTIGCYYVTKYDNTWYRIRAIQENNEGILCFFIDYGDELVVPKTRICQLKREFAQCQSQAFVCRLVGLEELYVTSQYSEILQNILHQEIVIELASDVKGDANDDTLPVYMYSLETGHSINKEMIPLLTIESSTPHFQKDTVLDVYISNVESNGDIYVQQHSHGYENFQNLISDLEDRILENPPTNLVKQIKKDDDLNKIYLSRHKTNGHYQRSQIIDWAPNGEFAQIYYVDIGTTDVIRASEEILYPLDKLSDILNQYPFQANQIKMAIDKVPENFVDLVQKTLSEDHMVLMKIIDYDEGKIPRAEFFKRNLDGSLFCINKSITMEDELKKGASCSAIKSLKMNRLSLEGKNVSSNRRLSAPSIPKENEFFKVRVSFAINPYNFFIQPYNSRKELFEMMEKLNDHYRDVQYSPLHVNDLIPGDIYASQYEDGNWYRTNVIKVIHSGSISVFFCDFGYYANITVQRLLPLDPEFMELPYQALKAKIGNAKPKISNKWTVSDCDIFKELVETKDFYSIMSGTETDELYESDIILKLILIDTSSSDDVYITDELVKKGIAIKM